MLIAARPALLKLADAHEERAHEFAAEGEDTRANWHYKRATSLRHRRQVVAECGDTAVASVIDCPHNHETSFTDLCCGDWRLCLHCRQIRLQRYRNRFLDARVAALQSAPRTCRERFITVTIPHLPGTDPQDRWAVLTETVRRFERRLKRWFPAIQYLTSREMTRGDDQCGHAHAHMWLMCPYIDHAVLRHWWAQALPAPFREMLPERDVVDVIADTPDHRKGALLQLDRYLRLRSNGPPCVTIRWPVVDIRAIRPGFEQELIKYTVKDAVKVDGQLEYFSPELFARFYVATLGRRTFSTSRGFLDPVPLHFCETCGTCDHLVDFIPWMQVMAGEPPRWLKKSKPKTEPERDN